MSSTGIIAMIFGALVVCSRGPLIFAPAATLRWFRKVIETKARTQILGAFIVLLAGSMAWAGVSQNNTLESVMFVVGLFILIFALPGLVLFPQVYIGMMDGILPEELTGSLMGWRAIGLVGTLIGIAIFRVGMAAL